MPFLPTIQHFKGAHLIQCLNQCQMTQIGILFDSAQEKFDI